MQFFPATRKDDVLLAQLDQFHGMTDTVCTGGASRGHGVVDAFNLERRGQTSRDSAAHRLCHAVGPDATDSSVSENIGRLDLIGRGGAPGARDNAGSRAGYLRGGQACVGNGLLQTQIGIARGVSHKSPLFAIDVLCQVDFWRACDVGAHAGIDMILSYRDTRLPGEQCIPHLAGVIAEARDDAQACNDNALGHHMDSVFWNRPTRRSEAV